ncbi:hypothetical protein BKA63DRAFT_568540 [Paraphoma chrysanthemicola]|nr:hypothetical protein BKA63DRAFT_568540 [Paraphoma chrysanthemicola]
MLFFNFLLGLIGLMSLTTAAPTDPNTNTTLEIAPRNEETCGWVITGTGITQLMISTPYCMDAEDNEPFIVARNDYCAICYTFTGKACAGARTWWGGRRENRDVSIAPSLSYRCMF